MIVSSEISPNVSVVVPAFNAAEWILPCLESILHQTYLSFEVIVINDGSKDETQQIVERVASKDERVAIFQQGNSGQSAAINRGVRESRGMFIKIVDADDWINPGHLESQVRSLEGTQDVVSCCSWGYFREDPWTAAPRLEQVDRDYDDPLNWLADSLTMDEGMMGGWRWLIPRGVWDRCGGYDERLGLNNDFDFSIRLLLASKGVRHAPDALYAYRKGVAGALSGTAGRKAMESAFLTTQLGCTSLLTREDSPRIRKICANRWQEWLYRFYPQFPDLASEAEAVISKLGGSSVRLQGGLILRILEPAIGWRAVRRLQVTAEPLGLRLMRKHFKRRA